MGGELFFSVHGEPWHTHANFFLLKLVTVESRDKDHFMLSERQLAEIIIYIKKGIGVEQMRH